MEIDAREALRYVGVAAPDTDMLARMERLAEELRREVHPRHVYRVCALWHTESGVALEGTNVLLTGRLAEKMLRDCDQAALLVCTLGSQFDALLRTRQQRDMAQAVMLDACGSAYVESVCNALEKEIAASYPDKYLTDRFSPGYGDLPLALQPEILAATNAMRRTGVVALPSMLMNPSKSVTAVIGLADKPQMARIRGCAYCAMAKTCTLRKQGEPCHA